jgi:antibiotic biosynthesis monooxygenase (ABM) superfamily enzyme
MDNRGRDGEHDPKEVTEVISRNIKAGHEKDYDDWLRRYMSLERKFQGYLGTTIIVPGGSNSSVRYVINRFADNASLDEWENSDDALKLLEEANDCSTQYYERATGMETWFILPDFKNIAVPPRWKMAIVAFIGAYCISSITRYILNLYLEPWPLLTSIVMNMILVVGLTYFAMPVLGRLLQRWLYPKNGMNYQR